MWYQITEARVGLGSGLTSWGANQTGFQAFNVSDMAQYWQILAYPKESNTYAFRSRSAGTSVALGTVFDPQEVDPSHTQPRILPINPDDNSQKWTFGNWSDDTYFIVNVANGSAFHLDVHPGNPVFMSSQTSAVPNNPGQHWEIQTIEAINDAGWSTTLSPVLTMSAVSASSTASSVISAVATVKTSSTGASSVFASKTDATAAAASSTANNTTPTSSSTAHSVSGNGLSPGGAAGIGVGSAAAVMLILAAILGVFYKRRLKRANDNQDKNETDNRLSSPARRRWLPVHEVSGENERIELPDTGFKPVELPTSFHYKKDND
ncbi:MAG: hypothetical protein M1821_004967 [Bathelium mastoideum]|nr:MAG: hypothetical protein M1821_004967 [Bathelium mastoideum]